MGSNQVTPGDIEEPLIAIYNTARILINVLGPPESAAAGISLSVFEG
jgi:hypothetical protein